MDNLRLVDTEKFNASVGDWSIKIRNKIRSNAPVYAGKLKTKDEKLQSSVSHTVGKLFGVAERVRFRFARHGIYVHYGVGRGWIRKSNAIVRGFLTDEAKTSKRKNISRENLPAGERKGRKPVDWFDMEIKLGMKELADITQEYYGDEAMRSLLEKLDKFLIQKD